MVGRIEDCGVIGDLRTMALVGPGRVDRLAVPAAVRLRWRLAPAGTGYRAQRRYRGDSLVLETDWEGPQGAVRVIDFMPLRAGAGEVADVVRIVQGISGRVPMRMELGLRFDYGSVTPWLTGPGSASTAGGLGDQHVALAVSADGGTWTAGFEVRAGPDVHRPARPGPGRDRALRRADPQTRRRMEVMLADLCVAALPRHRDAVERGERLLTG